MQTAHYDSEEKREYAQAEQLREVELQEVRSIFSGYSPKGDTLESVVDSIASNKKRWVDFMMKFELGLERPDPRRAPLSAGTIASSLPCRRNHPVAALHDRKRYEDGSFLVCHRNGRGSCGLRSGQREDDRHRSDQVEPSNASSRWPRGRRGVLFGLTVRLTAYVLLSCSSSSTRFFPVTIDLTRFSPCSTLAKITPTICKPTSKSVEYANAS